MIDLELDGSVAIVTGASRGLGRAITLALAEQGTRVLAVARLPDEAAREFGRVDIVVNTAGIAPAILTRAAGRHLIAQRSGKIINIASTSGILGKATLVAYSASKGA